jgi:hypothetical protein
METVEWAEKIALIFFACSGVFFVAAAVLFWKLHILSAIRILTGSARKKDLKSGQGVHQHDEGTSPL